MPLENAQAIDGVRKTEDGKIIAVITDEGTIAEPGERSAFLVQKLKVYINSIASGELKKDFPEKSFRDFIIEVACRQRPTPQMAGITEVMPRKDPANKVAVRFVELTAGAWGPAKAEKETRARVPAIEVKSAALEQLDTLSAAALEKGVEQAKKYLADGQKGFYFAVMGWDGNKTEAVFFRENSVTREVVREAEQYVRVLTPAFTVCVLASIGSLRVYRRDKREAIILVLHRRALEEARVYAVPIRGRSGSHQYVTDGRMEQVGRKPGLLAG